MHQVVHTHSSGSEPQRIAQMQRLLAITIALPPNHVSGFAVAGNVDPPPGHQKHMPVEESA